MAVTQKDVAEKAGVTRMVVSKVLHNGATGVRVSAATAERVKKVAEELGYRVNVVARNFRAQETHTIGVLHGIEPARPVFDSGSRYFAALADGIVGGAFDNDYAVTLCPKLYGENPEAAMSDGRFDGLVWYSMSRSEEAMRVLSQTAVPLVVIHARAKDVKGSHPTVICDNRQGIGLAVSHLASLGHQKIALGWMEDFSNPESIERVDAFHLEMREHGLSSDETNVVNLGRWKVSESDKAERHRLLMEHAARLNIDLRDPESRDWRWEWWELHRYMLERPRHTAIIAINDEVAGTILRTALLCGVHVPTQLSVVGFDSTSFCNELTPKLTSIRQPLREIGRTAVDLLVKRIHGEAVPQETVVACGFDIRKSTAPPNSR